MVVETEQEIALRSYGSRLRFVQRIAALEILKNFKIIRLIQVRVWFC